MLASRSDTIFLVTVIRWGVFVEAFPTADSTSYLAFCSANAVRSKLSILGIALDSSANLLAADIALLLPSNIPPSCAAESTSNTLAISAFPPNVLRDENSTFATISKLSSPAGGLYGSHVFSKPLSGD